MDLPKPTKSFRGWAPLPQEWLSSNEISETIVPPSHQLALCQNPTMGSGTEEVEVRGDEIEIYSGSGIQKVCPFDMICEFLEVVIRKKYPEARELCKQILVYEPENEAVREFQQLLGERATRSTKEDGNETLDSESDSSTDDESETSSSLTSSSSSEDYSDSESDSEEHDSTYSTGDEGEDPRGAGHGHGDLLDPEMKVNIEKYVIDEMNAVGMKALSKFFHIDGSSEDESDGESSSSGSESESGESSDSEESEQDQDRDSGISNRGLSL